MKLTPREKEMKHQYGIIYKNLKIKFPQIDGTTEDEPTGYTYVPSSNEDRKTIKHLRTIIQLIDLYRKDFPEDWKKYLSYTFRENTKDRAYQLLSEKDLSGFEFLIKAWWARKININININISSKKLEDIDGFISFDEHMKKVISNILYIKKEKNGWNDTIELLHIKKMGDKKDKLDLYFNYLVKKYNVNINDVNFIPEENFNFIGSY